MGATRYPWFGAPIKCSVKAHCWGEGDKCTTRNKLYFRQKRDFFHSYQNIRRNLQNNGCVWLFGVRDLSQGELPAWWDTREWVGVTLQGKGCLSGLPTCPVSCQRMGWCDSPGSGMSLKVTYLPSELPENGLVWLSRVRDLLRGDGVHASSSGSNIFISSSCGSQPGNAHNYLWIILPDFTQTSLQKWSWLNVP